jgi:hypothetical protein
VVVVVLIWELAAPEGLAAVVMVRYQEPQRLPERLTRVAAVVAALELLVARQSHLRLAALVW